MTRNPWPEVTGIDGDWRHPDDKPLVQEVVTLPPQPWLGSFNHGRVCWLLGGFGTGENMAYSDPGLRPLIDEWARRNLAGDEPNIWIDPSPAFAALEPTRDVKWWLGPAARLIARSRRP